MSSMENTSSVSVRSTQLEEFDLLTLGGGTGSTVAAWTLAAEGKRVAVIYREYIGGSCPNIACLPSKKHHPHRKDRIVRSEGRGVRHQTWTASESTSPLFGIANARWCRA